MAVIPMLLGITGDVGVDVTSFGSRGGGGGCGIGIGGKFGLEDVGMSKSGGVRETTVACGTVSECRVLGTESFMGGGGVGGGGVWDGSTPPMMMFGSFRLILIFTSFGTLGWMMV